LTAIADQSLLADELEYAELREMYRAAGPQLARQLGLELIEDDDVKLGIAAALPPSAVVLNHGFVRNHPAAIIRAAAAYRRAGVVRFFLQVEGMPDPQTLADARLLPARAWQRFRRDASLPVAERENAVTVREIGRDEGEAWADIFCDAFDLGDVAKPWFARLPGSGDQHCFLSEIDGQPAGTSGLLVRGEVGLVNMGATAPAFRRRGAQGAALAHRLSEALRLGCTTIYTLTGKAVPGASQQSYANIKRAGFVEEIVHHNYAPDSEHPAPAA